MVTTLIHSIFDVSPQPETRRAEEGAEPTPPKSSSSQRDSFTLPPPPLVPSVAPISRKREEVFLRQGQMVMAKYRVERVLGRSHVAVRSVLRHVELQHDVLLVHLRASALAYAEAATPFLAGARKALKLQGEHVLRVIDAGRLDSGPPYVTVEHPLGPSLEEVLRISGPLSVSCAVDYALETCVALAEAHAAGFCHRHLSTRRLYATRLADGSSRIKVFGFGMGEVLCAAAVDEDASEASELEGEFTGIPEVLGCMAPEQLRDARCETPASDIWGVGLVLHELLAGKPVFQAVTRAALVAMIAADPPAPLGAAGAAVPVELVQIILRCMAKSPTARYASVAEVAAALAPFASEQRRGLAERVARTLGADAVAVSAGAAVPWVQPEPVRSTSSDARRVPLSAPVTSARGRVFVLSAAALLVGVGAVLFGASLAPRLSASTLELVPAAAPAFLSVPEMAPKATVAVEAPLGPASTQNAPAASGPFAVKPKRVPATSSSPAAGSRPSAVRPQIAPAASGMPAASVMVTKPLAAEAKAPVAAKQSPDLFDDTM